MPQKRAMYFLVVLTLDIRSLPNKHHITYLKATKQMKLLLTEILY